LPKCLVGREETTKAVFERKDSFLWRTCREEITKSEEPLKRCSINTAIPDRKYTVISGCSLLLT
jgi:hypothetical protein